MVNTNNIKATLLALKSSDEHSVETRLQKTFCPAGNCVIKGIIFFGTPFRGSWMGSIVAPLGTILPINRTHTKSLRLKSRAVAAVVDTFERQTRLNNISLLIFYELMRSPLWMVSLHL
jgi:hypothetical protein